MTATGAIASSRRRNSVPVGPVNVITNGDFSNSDTGWQEFWYSGKSVTGGKAVFTSSPAYDGITQSVTLTAGKYYELTWTLSAYASGSIYPRLLGGTTVNGTSRAANGTYKERLLVATGNNQLSILMDVGGTVSVDDVSLVGPYNTATVGGA